MQRDTLTQEPYRSEVRPQQEEDTIDLLELCMGLLDHWKFIAAAAAAGAVLAALYTFLLVTPLYKATSTIYVVSRNDSVLNLSDIQIGSALTSEDVYKRQGLHPAGHHQTGWHLSGRGGWLYGVLSGCRCVAAGGAAIVLRKS